MKTRTYLGIDNGVSGSVGIIVVSKNSRETYFFKMPTFSEQSYTKKKANITRIDVRRLRAILGKFKDAQVVLERPMVNPARFRASTSALRALEATLITLETLGMSKIWVDSREWQKILLPKGVKGADLKKASLDIAARMFPEHKDAIVKQKDGDGILLAEHCRRIFS